MSDIVFISSYFQIFGERWFAANHRSLKKFAANCFWANGCSPTGELICGELLANAFAANDRSRPANVRQIFESCRRRRHFWRTVRQFAANSERIRANSGEFSESSANVRRTLAEFARKMLANCWRTWSEFARIHANLRELARVCGERPRRSPSQVPLIVVIA